MNASRKLKESDQIKDLEKKMIGTHFNIHIGYESPQCYVQLCVCAHNLMFS